MFFKTRTNFFPKYVSEEKTLLIHKNTIAQKAILEEVDYKCLLDILATFRNGESLDLTDKSNQFKKLVKFSLVNNLIHQPTKVEGISEYILDFIENTFDDYAPVLEKLVATNLEYISVPAYVHNFFKEHGLMQHSISNKLTQRIIWLQENNNIKLILSDLCIIHQSGTYVLFFYNEKSDYKQAVSLLGDDGDLNHKQSIGSDILSMHLFLKYINNLQDESETDIITRISKNGQVNQINKKAVDSTYSQYERTFTKPYAEKNLEYIQAIENKFLAFESLSFSFNEEDGTYLNQLNIAQYEIKVDEEFNYTVFDYSYRDAAEYSLTHVLEKYLQSKNTYQERWIAENSKERFYIRGIASYLQTNPAFYQLTNLPQQITNRIIYSTNFSERISDIKIIVHYIYKSYVFYIYLVDQDDHILYKSELSTQMEEEINRGLAYITASVINQIDIKKDSFRQPLSTLTYPHKVVLDEVIYQEIIHDTRHLDIEEMAWAYQPQFEPHGLFIGRFKMNGVT